MSDTIEKLPRVEKIERPARLWKNKYRALCNYRDGLSGAYRIAGSTYYGFGTFVSADLAESSARNAPNNSAFVIGNAEYLGAFPVEGS